MKDIIYREDAISTVKKWFDFIELNGDICIDGLISLPSAERTGKWIDIDPQSYTWKCRCPECGHERSMMSTQGNHPKFCENCGLRLK